ncbi:GIY-YIG nuclease family protein [Pseudorhodobacter wandonensis]|uniref:GIY-YIG nuclease family protein n=1 Tax=Pseudorhodobacter wandonensis TaxID=1120568 RepID=UPI000A9E96FC|nr:GIY-YIG nuclease family protein [Pseudorhodobacter wandonensis]
MENEIDAELFDDLVAKRLGHYVYALFDPATGQPFYVGKGGGRAGLGNRRIFDHFDEARGNGGKERDKIAKIREIWKTTGDVQWKIVRSGLRNDDEALLIESALIDMLREMKIPLTNKQSGHGSVESGMKSRTELRAWCAPKLDLSSLPPSLMKRPIFIFNIDRGVADRRKNYPDDGSDLYKEATCQFWNVSAKYRSLEGAIAIGCINGITRAAVDIEGWKQVSDTRWEIVPHSFANATQHLNNLTYKKVSTIVDHCKGFWQRGNFLVIRIDNNANITVLRGSGNHTISLPPNAS